MQPLLQAVEGKPQPGLLAQSRDLWNEAPAWRLLVVSTAVLCAASIASPLLLPEQAPPGPSVVSASIPVAPPAASAPPPVSVPPASTATPPRPPAVTPHREAKAEPAPAKPPAPLPYLIAPWTPPPAVMPSPPPAPTLARPTPAHRHHPAVAPRIAALPANPDASASGNDDACGLLSARGRGGQGEVVSLLSRAQATTLLERTQASIGGKITPSYRGNVRAVLGVPDARSPRRVYVAVPKDMIVKPGDQVTFAAGHRDSTMPCNYIPSLINGLAPPETSEGNN